MTRIEMLRKLLAEATPGTLKAGACVVTSGDIAVACVRQGARLTCQRVECATLIAGRQRAFASLLAAAVNNLPALLDAAEALAKTLPYLEEHAVDTCYGAVMVEDPRDFHPDPDASTEEERARHRAACEAWDRGERPETPCGGIAECEITDRKTGEKRKTIGFVERKGFGQGTNTIRDPEAEDLRDRARRALAALAKEGA